MKKRILQITTIITPLLCVLLVLFVTGHGMRVDILVPVWNDETGWFSQVSAMIEYGSPLGYYGYNGTHAAVGTFGPWGIAPLIPYALFGSIFGWNLFSMAVANIFFLCCAVGIFIFFTKPNCRQLVQISIMYCCLNITVGYSMTSMSEGLRYSIGIILLGLLVYLARNIVFSEKHWRTKEYLIVVLSGIFIFYAVNVYLIYALALPVYFYLVLSKAEKLHKFRIPISIISTLFFSALANYLVGIVTAPYTTSTLANIMYSFKNKGIYQGIYYVINTLFTNLQTVNLFQQTTNGDILAWFYLKYIIVLVYLIWKLFSSDKKGKNCCGKDRGTMIYLGVSLYILLGFLIGYCLLYTGSDWTLCRGINAGFTCFLLFLCINRDFNMKKLIVLLSLVSIMSTYSYYSDLTADRQAAAGSMKYIGTEKEKMKEVISLSPENDRWENTFACYGDIPFLLALPDGAGLNSMMDGSVNVNAKYAIVAQNVRGTYLALLQSNNHEVIYENDSFIILLNKK